MTSTLHPAHIRESAGSADLATLRVLFKEYGEALARNPSGAGSICIEGLAREIQALPAGYEALLIAERNGDALGCVALKPAKLEHACEMKRLWVRPAARGLGLGRDLVVQALEWARTHAYRWMYLDTAPEAMPAAQSLYRSLGFEPIERFNDNPVPGIVFFRRNLTA